MTSADYSSAETGNADVPTFAVVFETVFRNEKQKNKNEEQKEKR
jgi:hypothetical protein